MSKESAFYDCDDNTEPVNKSPSPSSLSILTDKSRRQYEFVYYRFKDWLEKEGYENCTEDSLLKFFTEKSKTLKSSSLWAEYSMLKTTLAVKENLDVRQFTKVTEFLKRASIGYRPNQSKVFTREQFYRFLAEAPDDKYLMMKVAAILGIAGGCRREELQKMTTDDIEDNGSVLVVQIPETITTKPRSFVVSGKSELNIINIYRKYVSLRPRFVQSNRVFVHFHKGKCTEQVVGANTLAKIPSEIATFLGLPNPTEYTGHCFRRSSLNLLNDTGANILTVNNSWKNSSTVDGMINSTTSEIAVTQNLEKEDQIQCDSPKIKEEPKTFFEHSNFEFEDFELPEPEEPVEEKPFIRKKRKMSSETKSQTDLEILPHTYTVPNIQMDSLDKVQEKDEISLFTELLATKLRKLDSTSRIIICNKIDNMMFEAELKLLQENKTRLDPLTQDVPTTSVESVEKKVLSSQSSPAGSEESASSE